LGIARHPQIYPQLGTGLPWQLALRYRRLRQLGGPSVIRDVDHHIRLLLPARVGQSRLRRGIRPKQLPLFADSICPPCCPLIIGLPLAWVGQLAAVATGEDSATVENRHATLAIATGFATVCGTQKPRALPAKVAGGPVEIDGIAVRPVLVAVSLAIGEDYPVRFGAYPDGSNNLATAWPLTDEGTMWGKQSFPFPAPHVDGSVIVGSAFRINPNHDDLLPGRRRRFPGGLSGCGGLDLWFLVRTGVGQRLELFLECRHLPFEIRRPLAGRRRILA